ncbi:MAG: hypothetical protein ACI9RM_002050 [Ulvibacter sp.]|jgi:hypothetical protein
MKSIKLLKIMIDLFFYGSIVLFLFIVYLFSQFDNSISSSILSLGLGTLHGHEYFTVSGKTFDTLSPSIVILFIFALLRVASFFIAVYHIKQLAGSFIKDELFSDRTSRNLKMIGYGIIVYVISETIIEHLPAFLNNLIGTTMSGFFFSGLSSAWFQFTLGLLFIFMDKVFRNARALKQENELTI